MVRSQKEGPMAQDGQTRLMIILGSVREQGFGQHIADWVRQAAEADDRFDVDFADLREINLPFMSEPNHPRAQQYTQQVTKDWAERVGSADAYILAFPEYNHSYSAPIKNALDYLVLEWDRKPVSFVNWGGNSGGTRAQAALKPVVANLGMVLTHGMIEANFAQTQLDDNSEFQPTEQQETVLGLILDEITALDSVLSPLRENA
ncbi:MAG: NADPH-dependent FMN reductase [Canibacter sp.]